jgi:hypothetical protein
MEVNALPTMIARSANPTSTRPVAIANTGLQGRVGLQIAYCSDQPLRSDGV